MISYTYDTWGKLISIKNGSGTDVTNDITSIGNINPYRYRGYRYDAETGMYYLQSRYYNPEFDRFINADDASATTTQTSNFYNKNLFSYCDNNPVTRIDSDGEFWNIVAGAFFGGVIAAGFQIIDNVSSGEKWNNNFIGALAGGAVGGMFAASGLGLVGSACMGSLTESLVNEVSTYGNGKKLTSGNLQKSLNTVAINTAKQTVLAIATGKVADKVIKINPGWIKPEKIIKCFTGNYAKKVAMNSIVQATSQTSVNKLISMGWGKINTNSVVNKSSTKSTYFLLRLSH